MDYAKESLRLHYEWRGKLEVTPRAEVNTKEALSLAYTPGVAQPCLEIQKDISKSYDLTRRWNTVAVVTDGTAVLGLGDIGPEAGCRSWRANVFSLRHSEGWMPSLCASAPKKSMTSSIQSPCSPALLAASIWKTSLRLAALKSRRS